MQFFDVVVSYFCLVASAQQKHILIYIRYSILLGENVIVFTHYTILESGILALLQAYGHCQSNNKQMKPKHTNKTLQKMMIKLRYTLPNGSKPLKGIIR